MKSISDIITQIQQVLQSLGSPLASFTQYSNIYIIFRAVASIISDQYTYLNNVILNSTILSATGLNLDDRAKEYNLFRLPGSYATGYIYCTSPTNITLPINTIFSAPNSTYQFQTTQSYSITTSGTFVSIQSLSPTEAANIANGVVLTSSLYPSIKAVVGNTLDINGLPTGSLLGGVSPELDYAFRQRILGYLNTLQKGTLSTITNTLQNFGINIFYIKESYPVTGYFTIYIDTTNQSILDSIENNIILIKPIGTSFELKGISYTYIDLTFAVTVSSLTLASTISDSIKTNCYNYASSLTLNQNVYPVNFAVVCSNIVGVTSIRLTDPTASIIVPNTDSLIKLRNIYINISGS